MSEKRIYRSMSEYAINSTIEALDALIKAQQRQEKLNKKRWDKLSPIDKLNQNLECLKERIEVLENKLEKEKHWWNK